MSEAKEYTHEQLVAAYRKGREDGRMQLLSIKAGLSRIQDSMTNFKELSERLEGYGTRSAEIAAELVDRLQLYANEDKRQLENVSTTEERAIASLQRTAK